MSTSKAKALFDKIVRGCFGPKLNYVLRYYHHRGHFPNLKYPKDMSEILLSQLFDSDESMAKRYATYVDKLGVREYVKSKGLGDILLKHYGVWNTPEEIPFDELPDKFVLKSNNGCGNHVICRDKGTLDVAWALKTLHKAIDSGVNNIESHYHYIEPKVYAEELIETEDGSWPVDYKFTCIGGEIVDIFVAVDREFNLKYCTLDTNWKQLPYMREAYRPNIIPPKPKQLEELVNVAKILSQDFDFVRVDLYEYRNHPYISELTFFPWGGLMYGYTNEALKLYGDKWHEVIKKKGM